MTSRRTIVLGVVAWLAVVVVGAGLVWAVISRAGEGVASTAQPSVDSSLTLAPPSDSGRTAREPTTHRQTWSDTPGYVTAQCERRGVSLVGAQPNDGWRVGVEENGPGELEVEFESTDERLRYRVTSVCADGDPAFQLDVRDKG